MDNLFSSIKPPGPQPADPGPPPPAEQKEATKEWRLKQLASRNWLRQLRRYELAQAVCKII